MVPLMRVLAVLLALATVLLPGVPACALCLLAGGTCAPAVVGCCGESSAPEGPAARDDADLCACGPGCDGRTHATRTTRPDPLPDPAPAAGWAAGPFAAAPALVPAGLAGDGLFDTPPPFAIASPLRI